MQELEDKLLAQNVQVELRDEEFKREARLAIPYVREAYTITNDETLAECQWWCVHRGGGIDCV